MKLSVNIEKQFDNFHLKSSFEADSERFALLGASGSGKSMTLRCIAGIEKPDRGRIVLGDRVLFDSEKRICVPPKDRKIGYLFQNYALFPHMTVRQNVYCVAKDRKYADRLISRFELDGVADHYPAELSGGQAQRTAMARMLVVRPEVLLFDEPFSALDNYIKNRMEHEILGILDEFDGPSVLVSHDRNEVFRLASRIGVMDGGNIVEIQDRNGFFDHPRTVASARLTGCKNISRLTVRPDGTAYADDWGVSLNPGENVSFESAKMVGYRAHYFEFKDDKAWTDAGGNTDKQRILKEKILEDNDNHLNALDNMTNEIDCELVRVIEDTFSMTVCFRQAGNECETPDSLLTWVVDKGSWKEYEDRVMSGRFVLRINPERLMVFS